MSTYLRFSPLLTISNLRVLYLLGGHALGHQETALIGLVTLPYLHFCNQKNPLNLPLIGVIYIYIFWPVHFGRQVVYNVWLHMSRG